MLTCGKNVYDILSCKKQNKQNCIPHKSVYLVYYFMYMYINSMHNYLYIIYTFLIYMCIYLWVLYIF